MIADSVVSWLLTYLIHSTVLLLAASVVSRFLGDRRMSVQEFILRAALIGGVATTCVQLGCGVTPRLLQFSLSRQPTAAPAFELEQAPLTVHSTAPERSREHSSPSVRAIGGRWTIGLTATWSIGAFVALVGVARSLRDLRRLMRTRHFHPTGRLVRHMARAMRLRRHVRVSSSAAIPVPFATGMRRPEICCPERVGELAPAHRTNLFAHELAHLSRRDPAWQLIYRLVEAVFFVQPLNRHARMRLEEIAEHLADERAASCTGDRVGLARCLVVIAHWGSTSHLGLPATALASRGRLARRVQRLLDETADEPSAIRWAAPLVAGSLAVATVLLPAVGAGSARAEHSRIGSAAAPLQQSSAPLPEPPVDPPAVPGVAPHPAQESTKVIEPPPPVAPQPVPDVSGAPAPIAVPGSPPAPDPVAAPIAIAVPNQVSGPEDPATPPPPPPATSPLPAPAEDAPAHPQVDRAERAARERAAVRDRERAREEALRAREMEELARHRERALSTERERLAAEQRAQRDRLRAEEQVQRDRLLAEERALREQFRARVNEEVERSRDLSRDARRSLDERRAEIRKRIDKLHEEVLRQRREAIAEAEARAREMVEAARAKEAEARRHARPNRADATTRK